MFTRRIRTFLLAGFVSATIGAQAQAPEESRFLQPTASLYGTTGLWKILSPDTVPLGQGSFSVWYDRFGRNPGFLMISTVGVGGAVGLTDRLEFGAHLQINRKVLSHRINQLSFGQQTSGFFGNQTPGSPPLPSELVAGSNRMPQLRFPPSPFGALTGAAGYYNLAPFASKREGNGIGTVGLGFKMRILSETVGDPLGLGLRVYADIPTHRSANYLLARPTQTGDWQFGFDALASKNVGDLVGLYWNAGFRKVQDPDNGRIVNLSNVMPLSFGFTFPRTTRIQLVEELTADLLVGEKTPNTSFGAEDALDITVGFRLFLNRYLSLSGGLRVPLSQFGDDKHGFVANLAYNYGPPMMIAAPTPPSLTCTADPSEVLAGETVRLAAQGVSSTGAMLTYEWSTTAGTLEGSGPVVQLRTTGLAPGAYSATVRATEAPGVFADCTTRVTVRPPPPPPPEPPTVSCTANPAQAQVGEVVALSATARSPQNRPLTYQWVTTVGRIDGTGASVRFDTTGVAPGTYTVRVRVTDDQNQSAECTMTVTLTAPPPPPPPPQVTRLDQCSFGRNSSRVDNVCKAKLDSIALRLQSEADATLAIVGFAESNETNPPRLSQARADNTKAYLSREKGIAESRLDARTGAPGTGASMRRVEMHLVPRGATFTGRNILRDPRPEADGAKAQVAAVPPASSAGAHPVAETPRAGAASKPLALGSTTKKATPEPSRAEAQAPPRVRIATAR